jgi:hypothetical protein
VLQEWVQRLQRLQVWEVSSDFGRLMIAARRLS